MKDLYDIIKQDQELLDTISFYKKINDISLKYPNLTKLEIFESLLKDQDNVKSLFS